MQVTLKVEFALPRGATAGDAREYVLDAVSTWAGSLRPPGSYSDDDPGDAFFGLDRDSVKVTLLVSGTDAEAMKTRAYRWLRRSRPVNENNVDALAAEFIAVADAVQAQPRSTGDDKVLQGYRDEAAALRVENAQLRAGTVSDEQVRAGAIALFAQHRGESVAVATPKFDELSNLNRSSYEGLARRVLQAAND